MFLAATSALTAAGAVYAAWTGSLHVQGLITTASVDASWVSGRLDVREFITTRGQGDMPDTDDIAQCSATATPGAGLGDVSVLLANAFPLYGCEVTLVAEVGGALPVQVSGVTRTVTDASGRVAGPGEVSLDVHLTHLQAAPGEQPACDRESPLDVSAALNTGDRFCVIARTLVGLDSLMSTVYATRLQVDLSQWNLAGAPPDLRQPGP